MHDIKKYNYQLTNFKTMFDFIVLSHAIVLMVNSIVKPLKGICELMEHSSLMLCRKFQAQ